MTTTTPGIGRTAYYRLQIINFISSVMTLLPGDVILTGTPAGIGPMPAGAEVTVLIEGIGSLSNKVSPRAN